MTSTQERDVLRRLADELPDEAVHNVLQVARVTSSPADTETVSFVQDGVEYEITIRSVDAPHTATGIDPGDDPDQVPQARRARPAWIGAGRLGSDFASRAKDVLRDEMGKRNA